MATMATLAKADAAQAGETLFVGDGAQQQADELVANLNDSGHAVGSIITANKGQRTFPPGNFPSGAPVYEVVADGRNRLWRYSWADGGSYKLIFDPGI